MRHDSLTSLVRSLLIMAAWLASTVAAADPTAPMPLNKPLKVLFLGDRGHHQPAERFAQLEPVLGPRGIELVYTENLADLDPAKLAAFDAVAVYANVDTLPPAAEAAILRGGRSRLR